MFECERFFSFEYINKTGLLKVYKDKKLIDEIGVGVLQNSVPKNTAK